MASTDGQFRVARVESDHEVVVAVFGEVDIATAPQLMQAVGAALDNGGRVVLDLAEMTFIDSQGLKVLVQAYRANTSGRAARVALRSPQAHARKVLEITGLDKLLTIED